MFKTVPTERRHSDVDRSSNFRRSKTGEGLMVAELFSLKLSWMTLAFGDEEKENAYLQNLDARNVEVFRCPIWPILSAASLLQLLNYLVQCPLRCSDYCAGGVWQCAESESLTTILAFASIFVSIQFWAIALRSKRISFDTTFIVMSVLLSITPYFMSIHRNSILFGTERERYDSMGFRDDDGVPLLINFGVLCLGALVFRLRTSRFWWMGPSQACFYILWTLCFGFGIQESKYPSFVIFVVYVVLSVVVVQGRYTSEVWERKAWQTVQQQHDLLQQHRSKDDLFAARQAREALSAEYDDHARQLAALHVKLYMQFLVASQSESEDTANAIWSDAEDQVKLIQAKATELAKFDAEMLMAVLREYEANSGVWSYVQRMDAAWIAEHVAPDFKKCQPIKQVPRNTLRQDGRFVELPGQDTDWQTTNIECVRYASINATWLRNIAFNELQVLLETINHAKTVDCIGRKYQSINTDSFAGDLYDSNYVLLPDPEAEFCGPLANMKYGPMKTAESCMRKVADYCKEHAEVKGAWEIPDARYVLDQLRLTISTANPMVAAIVVEALFDIPFFQVVGMKNKYVGSTEEIMKTGSPSILINILAQHDVLPPQIFEVQVYIDAFLSLKHSQHKTYEFRRARSHDLLYPIVYKSGHHSHVIQEWYAWQTKLRKVFLSSSWERLSTLLLRRTQRRKSAVLRGVVKL